MLILPIISHCIGKHFFTCNLIVPCFLTPLLTTTAFYLIDYKIAFSISILVTLTVFFLLLVRLICELAIPSQRFVIIMFEGFNRHNTTKFISDDDVWALSDHNNDSRFTFDSLSVFTLNLRFRSRSAYHMSSWISKLFPSFLTKASKEIAVC
uniref:Uncharacterized protein n=1 Tax=Onchocerca volvulus TaxID=6282 RepID=A0A8R1XWN2_ONCVO